MYLQRLNHALGSSPRSFLTAARACLTASRALTPSRTAGSPVAFAPKTPAGMNYEWMMDEWWLSTFWLDENIKSQIPFNFCNFVYLAMKNFPLFLGIIPMFCSCLFSCKFVKFIQILRNLWGIIQVRCKPVIIIEWFKCSVIKYIKYVDIWFRLESNANFNL